MRKRFVVIWIILLGFGWFGGSLLGYNQGYHRGFSKASPKPPPAHILQPLDSNEAYGFAQQSLLQKYLGAYGFIFAGGWDYKDETYGKYWRIKYIPMSHNPTFQRKHQLCINVFQVALQELGTEPGLSQPVERYSDGWYRVIRMGDIQLCYKWKPLAQDPAFQYSG